MRKAALAAASLAMGAVAIGGCGADPGPTTRPSTAYERSENALKDPFSYSPNVGKPDDVSGGALGEFDRKGMQKDADDVLNP